MLTIPSALSIDVAPRRQELQMDALLWSLRTLSGFEVPLGGRDADGGGLA